MPITVVIKYNHFLNERKKLDKFIWIGGENICVQRAWKKTNQVSSHRARSNTFVVLTFFQLYGFSRSLIMLQNVHLNKLHHMQYILHTCTWNSINYFINSALIRYPMCPVRWQINKQNGLRAEWVQENSERSLLFLQSAAVFQSRLSLLSSAQLMLL